MDWGLLAAVAGPAALLPLLLPRFRAGLRRSLAPERTTAGGTPADFALPAREITLDGSNGKRLFAWYAPAPGATTAIVLLHGWGGNAGHLLPLAAPLYAAGHAVLLLDARCHGRSDEDDFASMPRFAEDLECALAWLRRQPETADARLATVGHSVGAAAALLAAARGDALAAVVSVAAFAHPESIMRRFLAAKRIPFVPLGWYALRYVERVIGQRFDAIAPENTIRDVRCPILLVHGRDDVTVPVDDARRLAERAAGRARLLLLPGDHERIDAEGDGMATLLAFLAGALRPRA
ncbi:MAG: alpha/beta fold hydrolase [Rhodocyclaceae bacterium]|nr:alpha/beta fold hydrolase [Rhodocyclaceae bacterium]